MLTLTITIGISASGKTTWASEEARGGHTVNINRDDLRFSLFGGLSRANYKFSKTREKLVTQMQEVMAKVALESGKHVIISDTNLSKKTRNRWQEFCKTNSCQFQFKKFDVGLEECQRRNALRSNGIPPDVINKQYLRYTDMFNEPKYVPDTTKPLAIICDIDGTLADMKGRSPFEWSRVKEDTLNTEVADYLHMQYEQGTTILLLSGRSDECEALTKEWLEDNNVKFDKLFMRPSNDFSKDTIIKKQIFDNNIRNNYNVLHALDDRPCVVNMWHDLGVRVWAVKDQRNTF